MVNIGTSWIRDIKKNESNGGVITILSDRSAKIVSNSSQSTYLYRDIKAIACETVIVEFKAKVVIGSAEVSIDCPTPGNSKNNLNITSNEWQEYSISYTVPNDARKGQAVRISIGQFGTHQGEVHISDVRYLIENSGSSFLRFACAGLFVISKGVAHLHESFTAIGIDESRISNVTDTMRIYVPPTGVDNKRGAPIFSANLTYDNQGTNKVIAKIGGYSRGDGSVNIVFIDSTTGLRIDMSKSSTFYVWVSGMCI